MAYCKRVFIFVLLLCCVVTNLAADHIQAVEDFFESAKTFWYDTPFENPACSAIFNAIVYQADLAIEFDDGVVPLQASGIFVKTGDSLFPYRTPTDFFTSKEFLLTLNKDYRLLTDEDAYVFQSFLYVVDGNFFHEGFFNEGTTWYFVRDEFFGDIEAWIVETDSEGRIVLLEHGYGVELDLPQEMKEASNQERYYSQGASLEVTDEDLEFMRQHLEERLVYDLEVFPIENEVLPRIWDGRWYELVISTEEDDEDYSYTTTFNAYAFDKGNELFLYGSVEEALNSYIVMDSVHDDFVLLEEEQVILFEAALDTLLTHDNVDTSRLLRNGNWYFIRSQWFGDGEGFVVSIDDLGHISSIYYDYYIAMDAQEEELEEPFDASLVDWTMYRLEPEEDVYTIIEGEGVEVGLEFDAYAASQVGAWMMTLFNGEFWGMNYSSDGMSSPYYDWISPEILPVGQHSLSYLLMKPGSETEEPLSRVDFEVVVQPFDATGVDWDLRLTSPGSTSIDGQEGVSIPLIVEFNDIATAKHGVGLAIRYQGEVVGGESSRYLSSPFETIVPGSVLTLGSHVVDILLMPPGRQDQDPLALISITIQVK
jgi:hypothetical protein